MSLLRMLIPKQYIVQPYNCICYNIGRTRIVGIHICGREKGDLHSTNNVK